MAEETPRYVLNLLLVLDLVCNLSEFGSDFLRLFNGFCRYAVVTGANRGIGFEICRQLASEGIRVVLTSRDENRGLEAVETLKKELEISDQSLLFHQLDVADPASITSLAEFVKTQFGKLDILVGIISKLSLISLL